MRPFLLFCGLLCFCETAHAMPSRVWWPTWTISSSEELSQGIEYSKNDYTPSFPLSYLFDGNSKTAWVYSAKSPEFFAPFKSRYGIELKPKTPVTIDVLRIMNGQNLSRARFLRNKRVTKIRVSMQSGKEKITRDFSLPDTMGFHSISLPRRKISSLRIEFIGFKNGSGDNDLCLSELALMNGKKKIDLKMPRAVMFYDGLEGCGSSLLIRGEQSLDGIATDIGWEDEWSHDARYVAGMAGGGDESKAYLWIADVWRGKILRRVHGDSSIYSWKGNRLQLSKYVNEKLVSIKFLTPPLFR